MKSLPDLDKLTRTKVVATVGPACADVDSLAQLITAGVDIFRINMAHGTRTTHQALVDHIRSASQQADRQVGILIDLAGPKIRLGELHTDPVYFEPGSTCEFIRGDQPEHARQLTCNYKTLVDDVQPGDALILCDGLVRLQAISNDGSVVQCQVIDGGEVRSRRGVNLPGVNLNVSALGEVDIDNARWAASCDVDFVSLSFVRNAKEIEQLTALLQEEKSSALVIAKIEKAEALDELEDIVRATDGVMVARGDLGVEIRIEKTPLAQKRIIDTCQDLGKPVIVATQMLETMHHNAQPTRAEVSDVANAILDGADACMLSGETAVGDHPQKVVEMMRRIMLETEQELANQPSRRVSDEILVKQGVSEAVVFGAAQIAKRIGAKIVVIATPSGSAALVKSKQRDFIPTIAITDHVEVARRMNLFWGITPFLAPTIDSQAEIVSFINDWAKTTGGLHQGDHAIMVIDSELWPGTHESVSVTQIL